MKTTSTSVQRLTKLALLLAIELAMRAIGLDSIMIGPLKMSFLTLPIAVAAMLCGPLESMALGAIFGNSWKYTQNLGTAGFYLDDWQVYDAILTEKEIQALRRTYCPSPFVLIVQ